MTRSYEFTITGVVDAEFDGHHQETERQAVLDEVMQLLRNPKWVDEGMTVIPIEDPQPRFIVTPFVAKMPDGEWEWYAVQDTEDDGERIGTPAGTVKVYFDREAAQRDADSRNTMGPIFARVDAYEALPIQPEPFDVNSMRKHLREYHACWTDDPMHKMVEHHDKFHDRGKADPTSRDAWQFAFPHRH